MSGTEIILHNYPQSPVAEKVRVTLGIKKANWRSVEIPRLPPKPMLTKLTGGYRRTPVMQIGADIYCDSQCIIRELEQRIPVPSMVPTSDAGLMWCLSRWTDGALFDLSVKIVLGSAGDALPKDFAEDRGRLYLGENWAEALKAANETLPHLVSQVRAPMHWLDKQLSDGRQFVMGDKPCALDAQIYCCVWFMRGRWDGGPSFFSEFPNVERWEKSVAAMGHGDMSELSPEDAIAIAKDSEPQAVSGIDSQEPQGFKAGDAVIISPDVDGGEQPVEGSLVMASAETVTLRRDNPDVGTVQVHFPRAGYRISAA